MARYTERQVFRISAETFDAYDDWIRAAQASGRNVRFGVNALVSLMARTNQAYAMQMSAGPIDTQARHGRRMTRGSYLGRRFVAGQNGPATPQAIYSTTDAAWKIPVRRITSRYYKGWQVRRLAPGVWLLENTSREAWFIEFGIHPRSIRATGQGTIYDARVRRPIRKLSLIKTLKLMDQSRAGERVWEVIYGGFREHATGRGRRGGLLINDEVQAIEGMQRL